MAPLQFGVETSGPDTEQGPETQEASSHVSKPTKRQRWATQRLAGSGARRKRVSIIDRLHKRTGSKDEKRSSNGTPPVPSLPAGDGADQNNDSQTEGETEDTGRRVYFNVPIPESERDEEGRLKAHYPRNKIRTAKYTPLTFVPKNLWLQFHNIANNYFLFIIILSVRSLFPSPLLDRVAPAVTVS